MRHLEREIDHIVRDHDGHGRRGQARGSRDHGHDRDHDPDHNPGHVDHAARVVHQAPTYRPVYAAHERDHHITTSGRRALPARLYALPPGPGEIRRGIAGRVPFDSYGRAKSGLSRLGMMRNRGTISARELREARHRILVHWPEIDRA